MDGTRRRSKPERKEKGYLPRDATYACHEFGKGVREILRKAADVLQNKLTRAQYLDEVTWTTKNWLGLQKQRISVVLHTAIAEQVVNELACGGGGRVHGAKCLAALAGVA